MRSLLCSRVLAPLLLLCAAGCGMTVASHLKDAPSARPAGLPPFLLDVDASSLEYTGNNAPDETDAAELKVVVATVLNGHLKPGDPNEPAQPARFRAHYSVSRHVWPFSWTIICIDLQLLGCPTGGASVTTDIELQVGDRYFRGAASATALGGLYYNGLTGTPAALAEATEEALTRLAPTTAPLQPPPEPR